MPDVKDTPTDDVLPPDEAGDEEFELTEDNAKEIAGAANILAVLLFQSAMKDEEKQIWVNLIPVMTGEQIEELQKILMTEQLGRIQYEELLKLKEQIMEVNEKYDQKIIAAQKKDLAELDKLEAEIDQLAKQ